MVVKQSALQNVHGFSINPWNFPLGHPIDHFEFKDTTVRIQKLQKCFAEKIRETVISKLGTVTRKVRVKGKGTNCSRLGVVTCSGEVPHLGSGPTVCALFTDLP